MIPAPIPDLNRITAPAAWHRPILSLRRLLTGILLAALAASGGCDAGPAEDRSGSAAEDGAVLPDESAAGSAADESERAPGGGNCPVIESRNWSARVTSGAAGERRLHVAGEIDLPTPAYTADWSEGPADRRMPPAQHLILELAAPDGMAAQVVTSITVEYEGDAIYPEYRAILVRCGDVVLASITDIEQESMRSDEI
jgi:hypothetical protein